MSVVWNVQSVQCGSSICWMRWRGLHKTSLLWAATISCRSLVTCSILHSIVSTGRFRFIQVLPREREPVCYGNCLPDPKWIPELLTWHLCPMAWLSIELWMNLSIYIWAYWSLLWSISCLFRIQADIQRLPQLGTALNTLLDHMNLEVDCTGCEKLNAKTHHLVSFESHYPFDALAGLPILGIVTACSMSVSDHHRIEMPICLDLDIDPYPFPFGGKHYTCIYAAQISLKPIEPRRLAGQWSSKSADPVHHMARSIERRPDRPIHTHVGITNYICIFTSQTVIRTSPCCASVANLTGEEGKVYQSRSPFPRFPALVASIFDPGAHGNLSRKEHPLSPQKGKPSFFL